MPDSDAALLAILASVTGAPVAIRSRSSLGGGDISRVERVVTDAGLFIVKSHPAAPAGFFRAEAAGLSALGANGTSLRIPEVFAVCDEPASIVLEDLGDGQPSADCDEAVGRGLAAVHSRRAPRFGFDGTTFCGLTPQPNDWTGSWVTFYGERRLGHQVAMASRARLLSSTETSRLEALISRLDTRITEPAEGPALIHGDLWSGNLHVTARGEPALIDPAVAFAHREAEFGMMTLFGGFSRRVYDAYEEAFRLEADWRKRNPLYQLYHLLNHLNLFGGGYRAQVMAIANRFV
jgi:fructosamine-3-kinase